MKRTVLTVISVLMCNMAMAGKIPKAENSVTSETAKNKVKSSFDTTSFDNKQDQLPPHYKGHSIELFQDTILNNEIIAKGKSEFETTATYEERKINALGSMKFADMSINSRWAFMFTPNIDGGPNIPGGFLKYDAEHSQFFHAFALYKGSKSHPMPSINLEVKSQIVGSYIAQNAMGAKAEIIREDRVSRQLGITQCKRDNPNFVGGNISSIWEEAEEGHYVHTFAMPPEQAKTQKPNLRFLLIVNSFISPYVMEENKHYNPKFPDELTEITSRTITTFSKLDAIWLYNYETGEIIKKIAPCSIQQHKNEKLKRLSAVLNYLF